jgi:hypothetical protein
MESTELVPRATIRDLIRCYDEAKANVSTAIGMLKASQTSLNSMFKLAGNTGVSIRMNRNRYDAFDADLIDAERVLKRMEQDAWRYLVDRFDIWRIMSEARAKELRDLIEKDELPTLTEESALQLMHSYTNAINANKLIDEFAKEVFDWLRPRRDEEGRGYNGAKFKTNREDVIGKRIVREFMIDRDDASRGRFHVRYDDSQQRLRVLENLFRALEGKGATGKGYCSDLETAINSSKDGTGQTEYFKFRACKKGTLHIEFLREDLLAELNRRAGGMNLNDGKDKQR